MHAQVSTSEGQGFAEFSLLTMLHRFDSSASLLHNWCYVVFSRDQLSFIGDTRRFEALSTNSIMVHPVIQLIVDKNNLSESRQKMAGFMGSSFKLSELEVIQ